MSILSRPPVASAVARLMQAGTMAAGHRLTARMRARLPEFTATTEELVIPTSVGIARTTVYRPLAPVSATPPVHVNLHGGGFVMATTELDDPLCRALAAQTGAVVLNVDYVVAPRHRFPVATYQMHEVLRWVVAHGTEHGWDGSRLTVGGQSAGGSLAAGASRLAFEQADPAIALQVLHYPALDLSIDPQQKHSPLAKPLLRPWMREVFDTAYVPPPADRTDRLVSPAGAADTVDLTGIAPAVVIAAEYDILHDEAKRYADRLASVGALVEYREIAGADHGYDGFDDELARTSYALIAEHLRRAVGTA
ncbi:carboxylesterase [Tersicoccus solisilvae]|uniref:Carboxylesterase n=1 Tax=Tersicoccus solisilvae TaxID=1882339 RepID=A0ABQ1NSK7_9MICC|nr:alpha/beta hydrolase [Tersicoccus solisilvae]GGC84380.1 carboxylesterase [Tersicoccus solisilvae]